MNTNAQNLYWHRKQSMIADQVISLRTDLVLKLVALPEWLEKEGVERQSKELVAAADFLEKHSQPGAEQVNNKTCRCECGYRCGGPGICELETLECLKTDDGNHYVRDCDHKWDGPWEELTNGGSVTCSGCGLRAIVHDFACGP